MVVYIDKNGDFMNLGPVVVTQQIVQPLSPGKAKPKQKDQKPPLLYIQRP